MSLAQQIAAMLNRRMKVIDSAFQHARVCCHQQSGKCPCDHLTCLGYQLKMNMEQGIEEGIAQRVAKELRAKINEELDSLRQSALNAGSLSHSIP